MKLLVGLLAYSCVWAATTVSVDGVTTQQAMMRVRTNQASCVVKLSAVNDFGAGYAPVPDVDTTLFADSDHCDRTGSQSWSGGYTVVLGKRAAELAADGKTRHSRSLQANTRYYYQISAGTDTVAGSFVTRNNATGHTRNDPRFDRSRPGEYAYPTPKWGTSDPVIDPHTGTAVRLMFGPGSGYLNTDDDATMAQAVGGAGWTASGNNGGSYTGTAQGYLYLRPTATAIEALSYGSLASSLDYVRLTTTLSGTATSVDVCLTKNRVTCSGATITQAITGTPTEYTIGTTVPVLDAWKDSPNYPTNQRDWGKRTGTATLAGTTLTWASGDLFSLDWANGSKISLGETECTVSSVTNEKVLALTAACVAEASYTFTARNGGFLVRAHTADDTTVTVASSVWGYRATGEPAMGSYGASRPCQSVAVDGGYYCSDNGIFSEYGAGAGLYWVSGTEARLIGLTVGTVGSTGLAHAECVNTEGTTWDATTAGKFYCINTADGDLAIYSIRYTGDNSAVTPTLGQALSPNTTQIELADIETAVETFTTGYAIPYTRAFHEAAGSEPWKILFQQAGKLFLRSRAGVSNSATDQVAWIAVYDPATSQIVAAMSTYGGAVGKPNRWCGHHSMGPGGDSGWFYQTCNLIGSDYTVSVSSGTLTASLSACPSNTVQPEVEGDSQCSDVVVASLTPLNSLSASLASIQLAAGDYVQVKADGSYDTETARILVVDGTTLTLLRGVLSQEVGVKLNHSGTLTLRMFPSAYKELWWNWSNDPYALGAGGDLREDPQTGNCHQVFEANIFLAGCGKAAVFGNGLVGSLVRNGALPDTFSATGYLVNWDASFAGSTYAISTTYNESHPSRSQYLATGQLQSTWFDQRTMMGDPTPAATGNVSKVGTYIYKVAASATSTMQYRQQGFIATTGIKPLVDVSPAVLADTAGDNYKFCVVVIAGDCYADSLSGEVYLNVPSAAQGYVYPTRGVDEPLSTLRDVQFTQNTHTAQSITQAAAPGVADPNGVGVRRISTAFAPYKIQTMYWNGRATPDGNRYYWKTDLLDGIAGALLIADLPPWPVRESTNRGAFIPVPVTLTGGAGVTARIRFGYHENGNPATALYCHERQAECATDASGTQPFLWTDEDQEWTTCTTSCTINVPAISGRVLYYIVDKRVGGVTTSSDLMTETVQ